MAEGLAVGERGLHVGEARGGSEALLRARHVAVDRDELQQALGTDDLDGADPEPGTGRRVARQGVHQRPSTCVTPTQVARPALPWSPLVHGGLVLLTRIVGGGPRLRKFFPTSCRLLWRNC